MNTAIVLSNSSTQLLRFVAETGSLAQAGHEPHIAEDGRSAWRAGIVLTSSALTQAFE